MSERMTFNDVNEEISPNDRAVKMICNKNFGICSIGETLEGGVYLNENSKVYFIHEDEVYFFTDDMQACFDMIIL